MGASEWVVGWPIGGGRSVCYLLLNTMSRRDGPVLVQQGGATLVQEGALAPLAQRHHPGPLAEGGLVAAHYARNPLIRLQLGHSRPSANQLGLFGNVALTRGRRKRGLARRCGRPRRCRAGQRESHCRHWRRTSGWSPCLVLLVLLLVLQSWCRVARDQWAASGLCGRLHGRLQVARQTGRKPRGDLERDVRQDGRLEAAQAGDQVVSGRVARHDLAGHLQVRRCSRPGLAVLRVDVARLDGRRRSAVVLRHEDGRTTSGGRLAGVGALVGDCLAGCCSGGGGGGAAARAQLRAAGAAVDGCCCG